MSVSIIRATSPCVSGNGRPVCVSINPSCRDYGNTGNAPGAALGEGREGKQWRISVGGRNGTAPKTR
jgi:hypothetical protein